MRTAERVRARTSLRTTAVAALFAALTATVLPAPSASADAPPAGRVLRVSTAGDGRQADGPSDRATVTPDGRSVGFSSQAGNLLPDGQARPPLTEAYVRDLRTGRLSWITGGLGSPVLSADGRYAAYIAFGPHAVNVFRADLRTGEQQPVDSGFDGSWDPSVSADGRFVAYRVAPAHPALPYWIEVRDMRTGTVEQVGRGPVREGLRGMSRPFLSADARYVAYQDDDLRQVFVRDRATGRTAVAAPGRAPVSLVQLSADGGTVVLTSGSDTYVRNWRSGITRRVPGVRGEAVSPDGRYLLCADGSSRLSLWDLRTGARRTVSDRPAAAVPGAVAEGGRAVVFSSPVRDGSQPDQVSDVYVWYPR
ncbi:TolB family protein [Streptomyces gamaensis]|uniref:TolB family protein n=1 Tax=Streptomyces gamaensis TaxID=1763542 RepID=A0ABW0YXS4_9ACTN